MIERSNSGFHDALVSHTTTGWPRLHFVEGPNHRPPLLLLHGLGRAWQDYEPLLPSLLPHWHLFGLDHRGHGDSERAHGRYLVNNYVSDVTRFVAERVPSGVVLFGHSLGAMVALAAAAELPGHIVGVVLEDPPFHTMGERIAETPWQSLFSGLREVARRGGSVDALAAAIGEIPVRTTDGGDSTLGQLRTAASLRFSAQWLAKVDPEIFSPVIAGRWLDGYEERVLFSRVQCPVLLLQGDRACGAVFTDEDAKIAMAACPLARCVQFHGTGHLIHQERPLAVWSALHDFAMNFAGLKIGQV